MSADDIEPRVRDLIAQVAGRDTAALHPDDDLVEKLGLDSLQGLRVLAMLEKRFALRFPDTLLSELRSLRRLVQAIEEASAKPGEGQSP